MKSLNRILTATLVGMAVLCLAGSASAQQQGRPGRGQGGFDPEQMRQRMMERFKEQLEITNDAEWQAIEPLVTKLMEARRDAMAGAMRGFMGRGPRGGGDQGDRPRFGPEPSAADQALERAIDSKASKEELKAAMAKVREERKAKEAAYKQAQENLRKVLSVRQEAIAVRNGWLD